MTDDLADNWDEPTELLSPDQQELVDQIEKLFGSVDTKSVRQVSRQLEQLVRQLGDPVMRRQYEAAIDLLPDIVAGGRED